ncbi:sigma-54-dependent Fis family transcriptional regulator [Geobacter sp. FeAm09]|uniref:sigma-54-dependent transcriptional regulator n=1 Tax=Geobacter sp. FeAm09 TaxID=2597769 RepID=UPI0011EC4A0C|nr:sigma-54 dependent transcriptional regulator [Geobacter sp. FeAm09]QEM68188.1 sigma-54-dependent Fis family transcriptional regulator [Geobacter sp. FeAm09]
MKTRILIVDDELSMREFLAILLEREGYGVVVASNAEEALRQIDGSLFDLVISDVQMPGLSGIELLARIKQTTPDTAVLMVTAFTAAEQAVEAMKLGAYDYISKPFKNEEIKILISKALEKQGLKRENTILRQEAAQRDGFCGIIGKSARMRELFDMIQKVAPSQSSVLIQGESGTGKELAARAIHACSPRKAKPFVAVNCGAIPESLIESELFGHKKGAFTGAVADRPGLFEQAEGGTLFLDEIGELPLLLQTKLLRVLQEREFRRVGDAKVFKADVRVLTASNRDLDEDIRTGAFREDLYYRINVVQIVMPPLRERIEDIPLLVEHFCRKLHPDAPATVSPGALKALMNYSFPGNIRELENIVERSLILDSEIIAEGSLPKQVTAGRAPCLGTEIVIPDEGMFLEPLLENLERQYLLKALEKTGGAKKKAAELLGMTFRSFRYRLAKLGMDSGVE